MERLTQDLGVSAADLQAAVEAAEAELTAACVRPSNPTETRSTRDDASDSDSDTAEGCAPDRGADETKHDTPVRATERTAAAARRAAEAARLGELSTRVGVPSPVLKRFGITPENLQLESSAGLTAMVDLLFLAFPRLRDLDRKYGQNVVDSRLYKLFRELSFESIFKMFTEVMVGVRTCIAREAAQTYMTHATNLLNMGHMYRNDKGQTVSEVYQETLQRAADPQTVETLFVTHYEALLQLYLAVENGGRVSESSSATASDGGGATGGAQDDPSSMESFARLCADMGAGAGAANTTMTKWAELGCELGVMGVDMRPFLVGDDRRTGVMTILGGQVMSLATLAAADTLLSHMGSEKYAQSTVLIVKIIMAGIFTSTTARDAIITALGTVTRTMKSDRMIQVAQEVVTLLYTYGGTALNIVSVKLMSALRDNRTSLASFESLQTLAELRSRKEFAEWNVKEVFMPYVAGTEYEAELDRLTPAHATPAAGAPGALDTCVSAESVTLQLQLDQSHSTAAAPASTAPVLDAGLGVHVSLAAGAAETTDAAPSAARPQPVASAASLLLQELLNGTAQTMSAAVSVVGGSATGVGAGPATDSAVTTAAAAAAAAPVTTPLDWSAFYSAYTSKHTSAQQ